MIKAFLSLTLLLLRLAIATSQTINVQDNACFGTGSVFTYAGNDGGSPSRNIYTGLTQASEPCRIIWDNTQSRWEIQLLDDFGGNPAIDFYENSFASSPNPPSLGTGTWNSLFCGSGLIQFDGSGTQSVLLPVEIISFNGNYSNGVVELKWTTASEINNEKFIIEYSVDGLSFKEAGTINGQGNSNTFIDYTFKHEFSSENGVIYYRIKQIDFDGKYEYSKLISINTSVRQESLKIFPNPSPGIINMTLDDTAYENGFLNIKDTTGNLIFSRVISDSTIDLSLLPKGIYIVEFIQHSKKNYSRLILY